MMQCPDCYAIFYAASAWDSGEPECEPGVLCPECGNFIPDDLILTGDQISDPDAAGGGVVYPFQLPQDNTEDE